MEFTIYLLINNNSGFIHHAYSDEKEAKKEALEFFNMFGEEYKIEPVSLTVNEIFSKRISAFFSKKDKKSKK